jgi:hypothetical protein
MVFNYKDIKAVLKSTLIEGTATEAVFTCERGVIKINTMFHMPTTVTITENVKEETIDFNYKTIGYNFETEHFNNLLRENKKESDVMTFEFSRTQIKTLDSVREIIGLEY